MPYTKVP